MKRFKQKGARPFEHPVRDPALPNRQAMRQLNKSGHTLNDYMKVSPMTMRPTNVPITPSVIQLAQKPM